MTTDGVKIPSGRGYTNDFPVERTISDAEVTHIYEDSGQIQRTVISERPVGWAR